MKEYKFHYVKPAQNRGLNDMDHVWEHYVAPFRMAPHVWMVGSNDDVCAFLLDSGEGLILIDTAMEQTMYLMVDSIHRIGFDPRDIKKILLSHWHGDHVNGCRLFKEMSGAEVYLSEADEQEHQKHAADTKPFYTIPYSVDKLYDEAKPVILGRFSIQVRICPGHTTGAACFFFDDTDEETGETYHIAMHGGAGTGSMKPENMDRCGYPYELAYKFVDKCHEFADYPADIILPSHMNQLNMMANLPEDPNDYHSFVEPGAWRAFMMERAAIVKSYYPAHYAGKTE